jgi:hypothetical protein
VNYNEIVNILIKNRIPSENVIFFSVLYSKFSLRLWRRIIREYHKWKKEHKVFYSRKWKCPEFSQFFKVFCQYHNYLYGEKNAAILMCGLVSYRSKSRFETGKSGTHMINIIIPSWGAEDVLFFEPQSQKFITLDKEEIDSISLIVF